MSAKTLADLREMVEKRRLTHADEIYHEWVDQVFKERDAWQSAHSRCMDDCGELRIQLSNAHKECDKLKQSAEFDRDHIHCLERDLKSTQVALTNLYQGREKLGQQFNEVCDQRDNLRAQLSQRRDFTLTAEPMGNYDDVKIDTWRLRAGDRLICDGLTMSQATELTKLGRWSREGAPAEPQVSNPVHQPEDVCECKHARIAHDWQVSRCQKCDCRQFVRAEIDIKPPARDLAALQEAATKLHDIIYADRRLLNNSAYEAVIDAIIKAAREVNT